MKTMISVLTAASMALTMAACNKDGNDGMNQADKEFFERAAYAHNAAVELGNLASANGSEATVKSYAAIVVTEHNTARTELKLQAGERNYTLPTNSDLEHQALKIVLDGKSGRGFDSIYMKGQVADHIQTIGIMQDEINNGKDQELKNYAAKYLPQAQQQKTAADAIVAAMNY
jgi:putative membrane protein